VSKETGQLLDERPGNVLAFRSKSDVFGSVLIMWQLYARVRYLRGPVEINII